MKRSDRSGQVEKTAKDGRRSFLGWFLGTSIGAMLVTAGYPVIRFLSPPRIPEPATHQVEAGTTNDPEFLEKGFKIIRFGNEPVIVIRVKEGDFRAFSATCTHLDCTVTYRSERSLIWCYCHNGVYDLSGRNIAGPPPRPLRVYRVHLDRRSQEQPATIVIEDA